MKFRYELIDAAITEWMARHGVPLLRCALGVIFFWFGFLKFFPDLSPAQELATRTIYDLTAGLVPDSVSLPVLAFWEVSIGLGLISGRYLRGTLLLLFVQMAGTLTPLVLYPGEVFTRVPYAPTLEGQYIIKNLILIAAGLVVGATARGGRMIADPDAARRADLEQKSRYRPLTTAN